MVLNELGARIGAALAQMSNAATIDERVLDDCLKEISNALVQVRPAPSSGSLLLEEMRAISSVEEASLTTGPAASNLHVKCMTVKAQVRRFRT